MMDINSVRSRLHAGHQYVVQQAGKLSHYTMSLIARTFDYVRQDARMSGATLAAANLAFIEVAYLGATLADQVFSGLAGDQMDWGRGIHALHSFVVLTFAVSLLAGLNVALYQALRPPLSPIVAATISTIACVGYVAFWWKKAH